MNRTMRAARKTLWPDATNAEVVSREFTEYQAARKRLGMSTTNIHLIERGGGSQNFIADLIDFYRYKASQHGLPMREFTYEVLCPDLFEERK